jgi:hypothetical protein
MRRLAFASIALTALLAAACGGSPGERKAGDRLYEARATAAGGVIEVVDSGSHAVVRTLPLGTASPDWKHLYSIVSTSLVDTDPVTGAVRRTLRLGAEYRLPIVTANGLPGGLSPNGSWLVVESADGTAMQLVDTSRWRLSSRIALGGDFRFDAVSNDGMRVYLIQYVRGKEYYVRLYDAAAGHLLADPVVDKNEGGEAMTGTRLTGVPSSGGDWLYSMYVRDHAQPFLHVLSLGGPFALCVDLPGSGIADDASTMRWTLAMDAAGGHLYATNAAAGIVVQLSVGGDGGAQITRTARFGAQPAAARDAGALTSLVRGDSLVVAAGSGVVWIDTTTLTVTRQALPGWAVNGLASSPDGRSVFAVGGDGRIARLDLATGAVSSSFDPHLDRPLALLRVAAA